jgi:hypothetical protein
MRRSACPPSTWVFSLAKRWLLGTHQGAVRPKQLPALGRAINDAMRAIEEENEDLRGVLPRTYTAIENPILVELLKILGPVKRREQTTGDRAAEHHSLPRRQNSTISSSGLGRRRRRRRNRAKSRRIWSRRENRILATAAGWIDGGLSVLPPPRPANLALGFSPGGQRT